jgi:histidinol-phosphate aminotransferase
MTLTRTSALKLCRAAVRSLPAYNAGISESVARTKFNLVHVTKLASNESPFGVSPTVEEALRKSLADVWRYPDSYCTALREEIQGLTGLDGTRIVFGNGSEDVIDMLCKALLSPGDRVVTLAPSFGLHEIFPLMMGATVHKVAVNAAFEYDLPAWCSALSRPAKLVMFSTPSNPVGCVLTSLQLRTLCEASPPDSVLVVDEAYHEYAKGPTYADVLQVLSGQARPWIVLRTLSKAYGLAGLRVGYGLASDSDLAALLDKVRTPFNVNTAAQAAAVAALRDIDHLNASVVATIRERQTLLEQLSALEAACSYGLRIAPSSGNFLFIDTGRPSRDVAGALMRNGVIVKPWLEPQFDTFIRVTVGRSAENHHFMEALAKVMQGRAPAGRS